MTGADFATARTEEHSPAVVSGAGACQSDKVLATALTAASVLLEGPLGAAAIPAGFSATGVTAAAAEGAAGAAGGATAGSAGAGGGGGLSSTALVVGGVAAGAGVGAAVAAGGGEPPDPRQSDDDLDGFSEAQGDCNDADARLHPNASTQEITATMADDGGALACSEPYGALRVSVQNISCRTLTADVRWSRAGSGPCCIGGTVGGGAPPTRESTLSFAVAPGETVARTFGGGGSFRACCSFARCCSLVCDLVDTLTVSTELGSRTFSSTYMETDFCPQCAATTTPGWGPPPVRLPW